MKHSRSGLTHLDKEEMLAAARNKENASGFDMQPWLNRKLFAADKKELADAMAMRTKKRERASWTTAKKTLKEAE